MAFIYNIEQKSVSLVTWLYFQKIIFFTSGYWISLAEKASKIKAVSQSYLINDHPENFKKFLRNTLVATTFNFNKSDPTRITFQNF